MNLKVHSIHFDADEKLLEFIQKKTDKLDTFFDKILGGEVFLRLEKGDSSRVKNKVVEVKLLVPGGSIFVKEENSTFEAAMDLALEALKTQIKKHKEKLTAKS